MLDRNEEESRIGSLISQPLRTGCVIEPIPFHYVEAPRGCGRNRRLVLIDAVRETPKLML
jgi:hypothetical protein